MTKKLAGEAKDQVLLAKRAGIEPDAWQVDVLRSNARQVVLNCSRQSGKSTITALLALHEALYSADSLILLLAPAQRQSIELFRKLKGAINALPLLPTQISEESALRIEFTNRSRIVCLPGKETTVRGFSDVSLLIVDEAARVSDDLYFAIRPMLAVSGGRIVLLSTPFGKRGFFFEEYTNGGAAWERHTITARECPRISADWLANEERTMGRHIFESEYFCIFHDALDSVFSSTDIERALDPSLKPFAI